MKIYKAITYVLIFIALAFILFMMAGCASMNRYQSQYRYNYLQNRNETAGESDVLKYNYQNPTAGWSYERPESELKWNYMENKYEWSR